MFIYLRYLIISLVAVSILFSPSILAQDVPAQTGQAKMAHSAIIKDMARRYKGEPRITHITEFGFEKNGIRFPSHYFIEEAYIKKKGKKIVHSETRVVYKNYKFFTVETEVKY